MSYHDGTTVFPIPFLALLQENWPQETRNISFPKLKAVCQSSDLSHVFLLVECGLCGSGGWCGSILMSRLQNTKFHMEPMIECRFFVQ